VGDALFNKPGSFVSNEIGAGEILHDCSSGE